MPLAEGFGEAEPPESVDKGTLATLRREGQAQFTCAAKPRSERAFTKPGLAGFVIILRGGKASSFLCKQLHQLIAGPV